MHKVHIVLDSTANVPIGMREKHKNLHVVPLTLTLGKNQWYEEQISNEQLFSLVQTTGEFPKTSQPAPGDFIHTFQPILDAGGEIIVITLSSGLSGTIQSARTAAQTLDPKRISVVDSGTTAIGMVNMAQTALALAAAFEPAGAIASHLEQLSKVTHTLFVPRTLDYLYKGGRIGGAAALIGGILQIHPVLYLNNGKVAVLDKVRTWTKAVGRIVEEVKQHNNPMHIGVVHIGAAREAEGLRQQLEMRYPEQSISLSTGGAVLAAHLGPGLLGVILQDALDVR